MTPEQRLDNLELLVARLELMLLGTIATMKAQAHYQATGDTPQWRTLVEEARSNFTQAEALEQPGSAEGSN